MFPPGLFITGTDTSVGKTWITSLIARELIADGIRVGAFKPACSGSIPGPDGKPVWEDVEQLAAAVGGGVDRERICPQCFHAPLAPPVAARAEGSEVDAALMSRGLAWWRENSEFVLVEGVGGLLCPLTEEQTVADFAGETGFPLIIVARLGLGTINHTLLTVEAARNRGLTIAGIIFNAPTEADQMSVSAETNPAEVARRCDVPVLYIVTHHQMSRLFRDEMRTRINWLALCPTSSSTPHPSDRPR